jgi:DNA-directed RNA polymerase specialized sigma24 family protein
MTSGDGTQMGGERLSFCTTVWSEIRQAGTEEPERRRAALEGLLVRYWKPVYCYLRRRGCSNDDAKDAVQGFFHEILLGRDLIGKADPAKGRFRTYLLTALKRYQTDVFRKEHAKQRCPQGRLLQLDVMHAEVIPDPDDSSSPEEVFNREWATVLMEQALPQTERELRESDRAVYWDLFHARVIEPITRETPPPGLPELCARHGVGDEAKASNMITTAKRRFRSILRGLVREMVDSANAAEPELRDLMHALAKRPARWQEKAV